MRHGWGCCPIAPVAADDPAAIGRTNDAVLYGGTVHLWIEAGDDEAADLARRLPSAASDAFGTPFGELLAAADWNFYDIDPMLFSPADGHADQHRVRPRASRWRARARGARALVRAVSARLRVGVLGASGSWHTRGLIGALAARGHEVVAIPATRLRSEVDAGGRVARARARRTSCSTRWTC